MKEYKRVTKVKSTSENTHIVYNEQGVALMSKELVDMLLAEHNQLFELEDKIEQGELVSKEWHDEQIGHAELVIEEYQSKIENGTLIELPCKVGDKFYEIDMIYCEYCEHEVGGFTIENNELIILDYMDNRYKASELYFTKAEAERKLKEQQNER